VNAGYLAQFKAALNWAKLQKLVAHLPGFSRIKRAKMSKGDEHEKATEPERKAEPKKPRTKRGKTSS